MDEELISKKELLELTGISYGQLYRWKRKKLIPEDWFIRKSTFTGQETFFRKRQILERIDKIKNLKEDLSLDELADVFSSLDESSGAGVHLNVALSKEQLIERNIVSKITMDFFVRQAGNVSVLPFPDILCLYILEKLLAAGEINFEEGKMLLDTFKNHYDQFAGKNFELIFIRKMGVSSLILAESAGNIRFDGGVRTVARIDAASCVEELKLKLK